MGSFTWYLFWLGIVPAGLIGLFLLLTMLPVGVMWFVIMFVWITWGVIS